jgi:hypothetical protein
VADRLPAERMALFHDNAARIYRLAVPAAGGGQRIARRLTVTRRFAMAVPLRFCPIWETLSARGPTATRKTANPRQREASFRHRARARFLAADRDMRRLAHGSSWTGLLTALAGETLVILDREAAVPGTDFESTRPAWTGPLPLSIWSAVGARRRDFRLGVVILMLPPAGPTPAPPADLLTTVDIDRRGPLRAEYRGHAAHHR